MVREMTFGKFLKMNRKKTDQTQKEFAKRLGIPTRTYLYYEHDERQPTLAKAQEFINRIGHTAYVIAPTPKEQAE
jgi:transcriptional regulator with XRE-family HTH domain